MTPYLLGAGLLLAIAAIAGARRSAAPWSGTGRRYGRPEVAAAIESVAAVYGIPRWFAWAQADKESGLNPAKTRIDAREDSWGLYQINMRPRAGHAAALAERGIGRQELLNPAVNADYFGRLARDIAIEARRRGWTGDWVWIWVRFRLKGGIDWDDAEKPLAQETLAKFRPFIRKWQARMGR